MIVRPFRVPEWIFAVLGALLLVALGLLSPAEAARGVASGTDVYLFLAGMMVLAEIARREGLFDWLAAFAARHAKGSPTRLFALTYGVGVLVTVFLSNDATAVVLTPAVAAVARAARAKDPVPYLLVCAFVANAASFVLPISNPANLVIFGDRMPGLADWLARFALPSLVAIVVTFLMLWLTQRRALKGTVESDVGQPVLGRGGKVAAAGLVLAALVLIAASALGRDLGWPTAAAGALTLLGVAIAERSNPVHALGKVSWDTLLLVAGLFVIVRALETTGLVTYAAVAMQFAAGAAPDLAPLGLGGALALLTNLTNNLPLGLLAGSVVAAARPPQAIVDAVLVAIDLGPNLSVTGSLATILWLTALRREGLSFGAWRFLKLGVVVAVPAVALTLVAVVLQAG